MLERSRFINNIKRIKKTGPVVGQYNPRFDYVRKQLPIINFTKCSFRNCALGKSNTNKFNTTLSTEITWSKNHKNLVFSPTNFRRKSNIQSKEARTRTLESAAFFGEKINKTFNLSRSEAKEAPENQVRNCGSFKNMTALKKEGKYEIKTPLNTISESVRERLADIWGDNKERGEIIILWTESCERSKNALDGYG